MALFLVLSLPFAVAAEGVRVQGLSLQENGKTLFLTGVEKPGLYRLSTGELASFFKQARDSGVLAVKTNAFSAGTAPMPLQTAADQVSEKALAQLDCMLAEAGKAGVKLILSLCADQGAEGGKQAYAAWVGSPNPNVFYIHFQCKGAYQNYVKALLNRTNALTGMKYSQDPAVLAWDLMDSPSNEGGDPKALTQWVKSMAAFVKGLSPRALVALTLDPQAPGLSADSAAGQGGVDFIIERLSPGAPSATQWSQKIGKPVAALLSAPKGAAKDLGAGALVGVSGNDSWTAMRPFFTAVSNEAAAGAPSLFASITAPAGDQPVLPWQAKQTIQITLQRPAKVLVRYGTGGLLDQETTLSTEAALDHKIELSRLTAGKDYSFQVKAVEGDAAQYSNTRVFSAPKVKALLAKPFKRTNNFITVKGTEFYDGDHPFRFMGTNNYYLHYTEPASMEYVMEWAEKLGLNVMRTWAFGETVKPEKDWADWEKRRYFTTAPGQYREAAFKDMDAVLASAAKHNLRLIMALSNNWADFGGAPEWVKFFGYTDKFDFFDKKECREAFKDYMKRMVNNVNTLTGVAYKDDPTIMAWDLMNEPWYQRDTTGKFLGTWIEEMSVYLKSLGVKQLVTTGMEGYRARNGTHYSGSDFILNQTYPSIDFATFHIYPTTQYTQYNLETTQAILKTYVKDGHEILKKPVVMEEFGIESGKPAYDRPPFIYGMIKAFFDAGGDGCNYWMLAEPTYHGDANQVDPTMVEICNVFVLQSDALRGGK